MDNGISGINSQYRRSPGRRLLDYSTAFTGTTEAAQKTDRRQENFPVENDRRSGADRRSGVDRRLQQNNINSSTPEKVDLFSKRTFASAINLTNTDSFTHNPGNEAKKLILGAASIIPGSRRLVSIDDNIDNHNDIKAMGLGAIGLINMKEDLRDILSMFGLVKSEATKGYYAKFKFFNGTALEKPLKKTDLGRKLLYNVDITLGDLKFSQKIRDLFGIQSKTNFFNKSINYAGLANETVSREYVNFFAKEGKAISSSKLFRGKVACLAMNRIPLLSLGIAAALELPKIIKSSKEGNGTKQALKSATSIGMTVGSGALLSSLLTVAGHFGPAGSIIGYGLGMFLGSKAAKLINSTY